MGVLTDPKTYESHPDEAWQRLKLRVKNRKALAVLMELAAWRERLAQSQDVPRSRILRDEALYDIANQAPTSTEQLSQLRTLSEGFSRSARARDIVEAVKRGPRARHEDRAGRLSRGAQLSAESSALVELLRVLLKASAARNRVAPKLIAGSEDLERIAVEAEPDIPALKGWRRRLFGEDALRLKRGEIALDAGRRRGRADRHRAPRPRSRSVGGGDPMTKVRPPRVPLAQLAYLLVFGIFALRLPGESARMAPPTTLDWITLGIAVFLLVITAYRVLISLGKPDA